MIKPGRDSKSKDSKANFLGLEHQVDISLPIKNAKSISFSDPSLTKTWDKGSKHVRQRILAQFLKEMTNATGPHLDKEFNNGASLFLLRISAWLRLTYLLGEDLVMILKAIGVFVSAASGSRFLTEFLEVGGVLTVLEILTISQTSDQDKAEAIILLTKIADSGRKYSEFICESYGIRQVTQYLSQAIESVSKDSAKNLLISLGSGNPKFQTQVFSGLKSIISSSSISPSTIQVAAHAMRMLLTNISEYSYSKEEEKEYKHSYQDSNLTSREKMSSNATEEITLDSNSPKPLTGQPRNNVYEYPSGIVETCALMLKSQHILVQNEGYELAKVLMNIIKYQDELLSLVISVLDGVHDSALTNVDGGFVVNEDRPAQRDIKRKLAANTLQCYASKLVEEIILNNTEVAEKLIQMQVVPGLLNVIVNKKHLESKKFAAKALVSLMKKFGRVYPIGVDIFELIMRNPETFFSELSSDQLLSFERNTKQGPDNTIEPNDNLADGINLTV